MNETVCAFLYAPYPKRQLPAHNDKQGSRKLYLE